MVVTKKIKNCCYAILPGVRHDSWVWSRHDGVDTDTRLHHILPGPSELTLSVLGRHGVSHTLTVDTITHIMATNSVRRLFVDAQQRVAAASSTSSSQCSCNSWSAMSSKGTSNNPPITMMARFVREDSKSSSGSNSSSSSGGGWGQKNFW